MADPLIVPRAMPAEYTIAEAEAHERGFRQGIEAARRACQLVHDRAPDMATCQTAIAAIRHIEAIPPPARPSPTRLGILGEG